MQCGGDEEGLKVAAGTKWIWGKKVEGRIAGTSISADANTIETPYRANV